MKVKLKDSIISELRSIGLEPGMVVKSNQVNTITGAVDFQHWYNGFSMDCVVWPEDYEIIPDDSDEFVLMKKEAVPASSSPGDSIENIVIPIAELTNTLDAMHWAFSPYLDNPDLLDYPWITNLIHHYNEIAKILPHPWDLQYEPIDYN